MYASNDFYVSLNNSGIGDQIMAARVACWLGEACNLKFKGLVSGANKDFANRSSHSANATGTEILCAMGLEKLLVDQPRNIRLVRIPYSETIGEMQQIVAEQAKAVTENETLALHADGAEAEYFYNRFAIPDSINIFETAFDKAWTNSQNETELRYDSCDVQEGGRFIVIHLRLGDTANLCIPDGKVIIPNHVIHLNDELGVREVGRTDFDRYDKTREIYDLIRKLRSAKQNFCVHSDGFDFTKKLFSDYKSVFERYATAQHFEREIYSRQQELLDHLSGVSSCVGESAASLAQFIADIRKSTHIISTTGHFAYNVASSFIKQRKISILTEKYSRTSVQHPSLSTKYWSGNFKEDIERFLSSEI
ncbi:hypothetical protein ACLBXJ_28115 [Methylobacterium mesophilicum]